MKDNLVKNNNSNSAKRIFIFIPMFVLLFLIVIYKLFTIQIIDSPKYKIAAKKQYESKISLRASRGIIFDRKMNPLVSNIVQYSFAADPNMVDNKDSVASVFASIFNKDKQFYLDKLNAVNTSFVWLERRIDPKYESIAKDINITGVIKLNEPNRVFSSDKVTSQLIGYTNIDNIGISGIELQMDDVLSGKEGYVVMQKDGLGKKRPAVEFPKKDPENGNNIILTIDFNLQKIVEEELYNGVTINNASGGKVIVMNVNTGEILAMNSINLDGSSPDKISEITDIYEPGSTFKIVAAAAALEESLLNKFDVINTYSGEYMNIKDSHKSSSLSFQQIIEQSSNVGTIQIANRLGSQRFYKYSRDFGYGITTGIDLPGEMKGYLKKPVEFSPVSLNYMAIGYEVLVTALQMTNAYACVANGGVLMKPFIVKKILSPDGKVLKENKPVEVRKVISKNTAKTLTELLVGVVERGTGKDAKLDNIKIAGKTGTSQKFVEGKYSKSKYTSSFIGYFPAENPQIVISVIIDAPGAGEYYGGKVSAPIFRKIAERIINSASIFEFSQPDKNENFEHASDLNYDNSFINLANFELSDAAAILNELNIEYEIIGPDINAFVANQEIIVTENKKKIRLFTSHSNKFVSYIKESSVKMPDLKGLSLRKCIKILSALGIEYHISGTGIVTEQFPESGTVLNNQHKIIIKCSANNFLSSNQF